MLSNNRSVGNNAADNKSLSSEKLLRDHFIPISTAGIIDRLLMHPVDNTITMKQKHPTTSVVNMLKPLLKSNPLNLYAGLTWSLASSIPIRLSIYSTYTITRDELQNRNLLPMYPAMLAGGALSGLLETTLLCPSDANRTRKVLNITLNNPYYLPHLFRGFTPLLMRTALENTIALAGSDILLSKLPATFANYPETAYITGTLSGILSQIVIAPLDNIKTRVMSDYTNKTLWQHTSDIYRERALFQATGLKILRTGIGTGLILGTISVVKKFTQAQQNENTSPRPGNR